MKNDKGATIPDNKSKFIRRRPRRVVVDGVWESLLDAGFRSQAIGSIPKLSASTTTQPDISTKD